jgi:hypothetical protein
LKTAAPGRVRADGLVVSPSFLLRDFAAIAADYRRLYAFARS